MTSLTTVLLFSLSLAVGARAAVIVSPFDPSASQAARVTVTSEIRIPLTVDTSANVLVVAFPDTYSSDQSLHNPPVIGQYGIPGSIQCYVEQASGAVIQAINYNSWGVISPATGILDSNDFYGSFLFSNTQNYDFKAGDVLVMTTGAFNLTYGVPAPDLPITDVEVLGFQPGYGSIAISNLVPVPEASTSLLGLAGLGAVALRRRRGL